MKISNFKYVGTIGGSLCDKKFKATVDVQIGFGPWKKTATRAVMRKYAGKWFFVDTGEFTPLSTVEDLARSFSARTGIGL